MVIVCTLILPHGAMTFDGNPNVPENSKTAERIKVIPDSQRRDCAVLFSACSEAADIVKKTSPDVIFLNTPHGISLSDAVGVYFNSCAKGNAGWNNNWNEFEVNVELDRDLAGKLIQRFIT